MAINIGIFHVGEAIEERIKSLKITQADFAKMLNVSQPSVNVLLKKSSMDTEKLKVISMLLDYNFFEDFCPELKKNKDKQLATITQESESDTIKELVKQMSFLRQEAERKDEVIKKLHEHIERLTQLHENKKDRASAG